MIGRRQFITLLCGAAAWPMAARAQQPALPVVGFLRDAAADGSGHFVAALRKGLSEAGFVEGRDVVIDYAWTDGHADRLPALAAGLVRRRVSVIVTSAINATVAAKAATSTIPIVFTVANDAVVFGLVASFNRPGGNLTGVSYLSSELGGKRLGLLHELLPQVTDFAILANPGNPTAALFVQDVEGAASTVGLRSEVFKAVNERDIGPAFVALSQRRLGALLVANDPVYTTQRAQIAALAARHAVPAMYTTREFAEAGGLLSYGPSLPEAYRQAGVYAGRVLKGAKPADLPVLLPTTFEMIINLKAAKALGLEIPPMLLARADEVIE